MPDPTPETETFMYEESSWIIKEINIEKQPPEVVCKKMCS